MGCQKMTDASVQHTEEVTLTPQLLQAMLRTPMPRLYTNTIAIAQSASDLSLLLLNVNTPVGLVSMSYTTAKSLVADLGNSLKEYEDATKEKLKTTGEIAQALTKHNKEQAK
jgi:hypothetical protein